MIFKNELKDMYPELDTYILQNNLTNEEHRVTLNMIKEAFGEKKANDILTGRSDHWTAVYTGLPESCIRVY